VTSKDDTRALQDMSFQAACAVSNGVVMKYFCLEQKSRGLKQYLLSELIFSGVGRWQS